jgi:alcohol dehydrogenase class IV
MYKLNLPKKVYYAPDTVLQLTELCKNAKRVAIMSNKGIMEAGVLQKPLSALEKLNVQVDLMLELPIEPTYIEAQKVLEDFLAIKADVIVGIGGGSVIDIAKLCSVLSDGIYSVYDLLQNPSLGKKKILSIMIPTTAGTGAEATPNAIVTLPEKELKVGIVCNEMIPDAVILDGKLIRDLPAPIASSTGIDALCHAIECYTSKAASPFSNMFAMEAIKLIFPNIEKACTDTEAIESKSLMLLAAFYAGVAITCSGTTAVHALSYPLGGKYRIPHGVSNAMLLVPVMRFNAPYCDKELAQIYDILGYTGKNTNPEKAEALINEVSRLVKVLQIPTSLKNYGVKTDDLESLTRAGMEIKRLLNNNKRPVTTEDARQLYQNLLK